MINYQDNKHIQTLNQIILPYVPDQFEGNCLYQHASSFSIDNNKNKLRNNLHQLAMHSSKILEIGINGGHSCVIFFEANPNAEILGFDLCCHPYTHKCCEYLSSVFNFKLVDGDSKITVPAHITNTKYDLIHIDGGHSIDNLISDVRNCKKLSHNDTILIIDDIPATQVKAGVNILLANKDIKDVTNILLEMSTYNLIETHYHRFYRYIL
jgi:hypothetical protein